MLDPDLESSNLKPQTSNHQPQTSISTTPRLQHSNIPLFHHSIIPLIPHLSSHLATTPLLHHSTPPPTSVCISRRDFLHYQHVTQTFFGINGSACPITRGEPAAS